MDAKRIARKLLVAGSLGLSFPALVSAQQRVGVVTNVEGTAMDRVVVDGNLLLEKLFAERK